jgi:hypothetical protein
MHLWGRCYRWNGLAQEDSLGAKEFKVLRQRRLRRIGRQMELDIFHRVRAAKQHTCFWIHIVVSRRIHRV